MAVHGVAVALSSWSVPQNRRLATRHEVELSATVTIAGGAPEPCTVRNLSLGGAYVALRRVAMGQKVKLTFRVPTVEESIDCAATVRWGDDGGIGVQFDGLRARETWAIGKYLESLQ